MLGQLAARNKMHVKSTMFPHRNTHLGTWRIPGTDETNQIGYSSSIINVMACRRPNCNSDHYSVKVKIRERLANLKNMFIRKKHWNVEKIVNNQQIRKEYQDEIQRKYEQRRDIEDQIDIDEHWKQVKALIIEAAGGEKIKNKV